MMGLRDLSLKTSLVSDEYLQPLNILKELCQIKDASTTKQPFADLVRFFYDKHSILCCDQIYPAILLNC